jgi:hypothetical protein
MASAIERCLYGSRGTHAVVWFALAPSRVVIAVAPWDELGSVTEATFEAAELRSVWAAEDAGPEDIALPWDIIGFDSNEVGDDQWEFVVCCGVVEYAWRSEWPRLTPRYDEPRPPIGVASGE